MLRNRNDLICDFAEYYHILDFEGLPVRLKATLAFGLPENSRSKLKLSGQKLSTETLLLAVIADKVQTIAWMLSEDGQEGTNRPKSITLSLLGESQEEAGEVTAFETPEEFERVRREIILGEKKT